MEIVILLKTYCKINANFKSTAKTNCNFKFMITVFEFQCNL